MTPIAYDRRKGTLGPYAIGQVAPLRPPRAAPATLVLRPGWHLRAGFVCRQQKEPGSSVVANSVPLGALSYLRIGGEFGSFLEL